MSGRDAAGRHGIGWMDGSMGRVVGWFGAVEPHLVHLRETPAKWRGVVQIPFRRCIAILLPPISARPRQSVAPIRRLRHLSPNSKAVGLSPAARVSATCTSRHRAGGCRDGSAIFLHFPPRTDTAGPGLYSFPMPQAAYLPAPMDRFAVGPVHPATCLYAKRDRVEVPNPEYGPDHLLVKPRPI